MKTRLILVGPIAALALAGCGSSSNSTTNSSATNPPAAAAPSAGAATAVSAFLTPLHAVSTIASTVPANGDVNPYGIALVPTTVGKLVVGNLLISNFNNKTSGQGTGTTIVQISPSGRQSLFANISASSLPGPCPGGSG